MLQSSELLKKSLGELKSQLREYQGELYLLKFKASTGQLDTTHKIQLVRRDIARLQTVINQKLQNKEQPPKVVRIKTPKTTPKPESRVESETQTLNQSSSLEERGLEVRTNQTQSPQQPQVFEELRTEEVAKQAETASTPEETKEQAEEKQNQKEGE